MKNNKEFLTEEVTRLSLLAKYCQNEKDYLNSMLVIIHFAENML